MIIEELKNTVTRLQNSAPPVKAIKMKSEFADCLIKMCPPITLSAADVEGVRGLFIGTPIVIDDEIENDYEAVY